MPGTDKIKISTGLMDLDILLGGLRPGDNVAWRVDSIDDYRHYVRHLARFIEINRLKAWYFRFADHPPLISGEPGIITVNLDPPGGFEQFVVDIFNSISGTEKGIYIFDSLSALPQNCYSDRMIGNFFRLICPRLHKQSALSYFSFMRYKHSYHAEQFISDTAELLIDIYSHENRRYIKPVQVKDRYNSGMFRLHEEREDKLDLVRESFRISDIISSEPWPGLRSASYRMIGIWDRMFLSAEETLGTSQNGEGKSGRTDEQFSRLLRFIISRDERVLNLAERYLTLEDLIFLWKRMIGTGFIGGKSVGMLLAHAVLKKECPELYMKLEKPDSFFIGSDIFYTFLIDNGLWQFKQEQKNSVTYLDSIDAARRKIMEGTFPPYLVQRLSDMLDYFGQTPIIVRSSSLLEDAFGNAFAGKYESVFCPNQGTGRKRLENLLAAIKTVYASTMSREALLYRQSRGVLDRDEQMPLLIQRVSGVPKGSFYYPQLSGVGFSFNPYAWSRDIDPRAGMMRLVFGLGTRAVDRADNEYTRVIALNAPSRRPESNTSEKKKYSQKKVDLINLQLNTFEKCDFQSLTDLENHLDLFATHDWQAERYYREKGITGKSSWFLSFEKLIGKTDFVEDISKILRTIKKTYGSNVDIEFTCNFVSPEEYRLCLVQCRPFQVDEHDIMDVHIPRVDEEDILMRATGAIVGRSPDTEIDTVIYIDPRTYGSLPDSRRYGAAGVINSLLQREEGKRRTVLIGPGRWGTSTPSLGVPATFSDIRQAYAICEIDSMHEGLIPDLSLGTHFFNEMIETGMVYMGYFNNRAENAFRENILLKGGNRLVSLLPDEEEWAEIIYVMDFPLEGKSLRMAADPVDQVGILYFTGSDHTSP